jgi:hypothetical protein
VQFDAVLLLTTRIDQFLEPGFAWDEWAHVLSFEIGIAVAAKALLLEKAKIVY